MKSPKVKIMNYILPDTLHKNTISQASGGHYFMGGMWVTKKPMNITDMHELKCSKKQSTYVRT